MTTGTYWLLANGFTSSLYTFPVGDAGGTKLYIGLAAFLLNFVVVVGWSALAGALGRTRSGRSLTDADYDPTAVVPGVPA